MISYHGAFDPTNIVARGPYARVVIQRTHRQPVVVWFRVPGIHHRRTAYPAERLHGVRRRAIARQQFLAPNKSKRRLGNGQPRPKAVPCDLRTSSSDNRAMRRPDRRSRIDPPHRHPPVSMPGLDNRRAAAYDAGVRRTRGLDKKDMCLFFRDGRCSTPFGTTNTSPGPSETFPSHLDRDATLEDEKEIVGFIVLVPDKFTLDLDDHEVVTVELPHVRGCQCPQRSKLLARLIGYASGRRQTDASLLRAFGDARHLRVVLAVRTPVGLGVDAVEIELDGESVRILHEHLEEMELRQVALARR